MNFYRKPILSCLPDIREALVSYYKSHGQLPKELKELLKEIPQKINERTLTTSVNDDVTWFSVDSNKRYLASFLYDSNLKHTYKNSSPNTIIVASPRFYNKRYVLLLKDVINPKPDCKRQPKSFIKIMNEDEFKRQAKAQSWSLPEQKYEPDRTLERRLEELKSRNSGETPGSKP